MNERGQSDSPVVPSRSPNNAARAVAEAAEGSGLAKGNTTSKTRPGFNAGVSVKSALDRVRRVASQDFERLALLGLEINPGKTRIVYCKDSNRTGSDEHERFDFLGYTFRPRSAMDRSGGLFVSFCPAISGEAAKTIRQTIRRWRLHLQGSLSLADLARKVNPIVRGWINYYGRFYPTELLRSLDRINEYLMRWAMRKYKGCAVTQRWHGSSWLRRASASPGSSLTGRPAQRQRLDDGSRMTGDCHVRF